MTLAAGEFIRRFLHVLPAGFHRIRYDGFLGAPSAGEAGPVPATPQRSRVHHDIG